MDTKNIPVSIYAQYKCLPFLFNKQFTTHPLTANFMYTVLFTQRNLIALWQLVRKARLGCRDRSL